MYRVLCTRNARLLAISASLASNGSTRFNLEYRSIRIQQLAANFARPILICCKINSRKEKKIVLSIFERIRIFDKSVSK